MPYIKNKSYRHAMNKIIKNKGWLFKEKGCLNYFLFKLAKDMYKNYDDYRKFEGEVQQSLREIYRRQTAIYEDKKIKENGDIE